MPAATYYGAYTGYVPNVRASGALFVGFSRNKKDFPVNNYVQYFPSTNTTGIYYVYTSREAARILTSDDAEHIWADGEAAPVGFGNTDSFVAQSYMTVRRSYPFTVGQMAIDQTDWNIITLESRNMAQKAMTARTMLVHAVASGASWGNNTKDVNNGILASGQNWTTGQDGLGSNPGQNIRKSLQYGAKQINLSTIGMVRPKDLILVVNPTTAQAMAASTEIQDYVKQSPYALAQQRGDAPWLNQSWDLPDMLYGYRIIVEDAVRVSSRKNAASETLGYVMADDTAYLMAAPGGLEGIAGNRSYSTIQLFFYKDELTAETMFDQPNKRTTGRVVTNYATVVSSVLTGFKFTKVTT